MKNCIPFLLLPFLLSSCLTSFVSLTSYNNIVTDKRLRGQWDYSGTTIKIQGLPETDYQSIFYEARKDNKPISLKDSIYYLKHYIIRYTREGILYTWVGTLAKIGANQYLTLKPDGYTFRGETNDPFPNTQVTVSYARVDWISDNEISLRFFNGDRIKKLILDNRVRISHEYDPSYGNFVITAQQGELIGFIEKYGSDEQLYEGALPIRLIRK